MCQIRNTIFYSWQSDLPNRKNRNFIESCIKKSIRQLGKESDYSLEIRVDRDTKQRRGTPDITDSIFDKIDRCHFFIADVSIINGKTRKYRRTPNPNVLIELGYAAKKLGWGKIICFFNTEFGNISDLPFDLRNRRILTYEFNGENKQEVTKHVQNILVKALREHYHDFIFSNELMDYYNGDIYLFLLGLIIDFAKILFGYDGPSSSIDAINRVLSLSKKDIVEILSNATLLGFQLFKSYEECVDGLCRQLEKIVPLKNFDDEHYVPIVRLINTLRTYNKELNRRGDLKLLNKVNATSAESKFRIMGSPENQGARYVLLKRMEKDNALVIDFGDFPREDHKENMLSEFRLTAHSLRFYSGFIHEVLCNVRSWIENNGSEFILDQTQLEVYRASGPT